MSPVPFGVRSEIHTIFTYDHDTHFDVYKRKFGRSVWWESSFKVDTLETHNWKQNFSEYLGQVFVLQLKNHDFG